MLHIVDSLRIARRYFCRVAQSYSHNQHFDFELSLGTRDLVEALKQLLLMQPEKTISFAQANTRSIFIGTLP